MVFLKGRRGSFNWICLRFSALELEVASKRGKPYLEGKNEIVCNDAG